MSKITWALTWDRIVKQVKSIFSGSFLHPCPRMSSICSGPSMVQVLIKCPVAVSIHAAAPMVFLLQGHQTWSVPCHVPSFFTKPPAAWPSKLNQGNMCYKSSQTLKNEEIRNVRNMSGQDIFWRGKPESLSLVSSHYTLEACFIFVSTETFLIKTINTILKKIIMKP